MLVLSRFEGQKVILSGGIVVEVIEIRGDRVRIGFTAPAEIRIDREEVDLKRRAESAIETDR